MILAKRLNSSKQSIYRINFCFFSPKEPLLTAWVHTLISSLYVELLLCLPKIYVFIFITLVDAISPANKSFVHSFNYIWPVVLC